MKTTDKQRAYLEEVVSLAWDDAEDKVVTPSYYGSSSNAREIVQALLDDPRVVLRVNPEGVHQVDSITMNGAPIQFIPVPVPVQPRFVPIPVVVQPY